MTTQDSDQIQDNFGFLSKGTTSDVVDEHGNIFVPPPKKKPQRQLAKTMLRRLKTIAIYVGLTVILAAYLFAGGYLFQALEINDEVDYCQKREFAYLSKLNTSSKRVYKLVKSIEDENRSMAIVRSLIVQFAEDLFVLDFQPSTNCSAILMDTRMAKWNLLNSIYFCVTIVTTIGYGHISPSTYWGRLSCIIYSIIGIPLMLVYLAIIGNYLAKIFRLVFVNLVCCRCFFDTVRHQKQKKRQRMKQWQADLREHEMEEAKRRGLPLPPALVSDDVAFDENDSEDDDYDKLYHNYGTSADKLNVPLTISISIMCVYTIIGGFVFPIWEDWTLADSIYFSFVTISTIGFGDLVPGNGRLNDPKTLVEMIFGGAYMIIGLALLSMCLNLMKDELEEKFKYIGGFLSGGKSKNCNRKTDLESLSSESLSGKTPNELSKLEESEMSTQASSTSLKNVDLIKSEASIKHRRSSAFNNDAFEND